MTKSDGGEYMTTPGMEKRRVNIIVGPYDSHCSDPIIPTITIPFPGKDVYHPVTPTLPLTPCSNSLLLFRALPNTMETDFAWQMEKPCSL